MPVNVVAVRGLASNFRVHTNLRTWSKSGCQATAMHLSNWYTLPLAGAHCSCPLLVPTLLTRADIACLLASTGAEALQHVAHFGQAPLAVHPEAYLPKPGPS